MNDEVYFNIANKDKRVIYFPESRAMSALTPIQSIDSLHRAQTSVHPPCLIKQVQDETINQLDKLIPLFCWAHPRRLSTRLFSDNIESSSMIDLRILSLLVQTNPSQNMPSTLCGYTAVMNFGNNASSLRRHLKSNYKFSNMQLHAHRLSAAITTWLKRRHRTDRGVNYTKRQKLTDCISIWYYSRVTRRRRENDPCRRRH